LKLSWIKSIDNNNIKYKLNPKRETIVIQKAHSKILQQLFFKKGIKVRIIIQKKKLFMKNVL